VALSRKTRKRLALLLLLVWLPTYVVVAVTVMGFFDRPHILVEIAIYLTLGVIWALPFRSVFRGVAAAPGEGSKTNEEDGEGSRSDRRP
jgi:hypothetical protein